MALVLNDRVKETTTTTGTGTLTLGGAVTGFETFAAGIGNSNTTYYTVILPGSAEFEVGLGTLSGDSSTIARTTIISSSNSDNAVDFSAGTKNIFCTIPASKSVFLDASGDVSIGGTITATGTSVFANLDISGDVDVDGTLEADAITVNGTALATVIAGTTVTTATNANHVSVADNESTNEENLIPFIEDASATGNVGLESDGDFAYNPSTGTVTATIFKGNIDAVDGDFDGTLEADAMTLNGTAITTTATLSTGISNGNVLVATSGIADDDFLRVDGTSIEGRSASEVLSDIGATTASAAADEATALAIALG